jgi:lipase chaperone LimK
MPNKPFLLALFSTPLLGVALGLGLIHFNRAPPAPIQSAKPAVAPAPVKASPGTATPTPDHSPARAPVLAELGLEIQVDGRVAEDSAGNLIIDLALRDYLDFFITQADRVGLAKARQALLLDAQAQLKTPAHDQLRELLQHYVNYRLALMALEQTAPAPLQDVTQASQIGQLRQIAEQVQHLRREHLGSAVSDAFFAEEEAYGRLTLARLELQADSRLSEAQRSQALAQLETQMPPAIQASRQRYAEETRRMNATARLLAEEQDPARVREVLARDYPPEAVERLFQEYEADRALRGRYQDYREEVRRLEAAPLDAADRQAQREALRQRLFSREEQDRLRVLELTQAEE